MQVLEDYLRKDLGVKEPLTFPEIRRAYLERAAEKVKDDWQSPAYLSSRENQAGRREGKIIANINDYTRDKHDLAHSYEKQFVKAYLPKLSILPNEVFVTSSGMAALSTAILAIHRMEGVGQAVLLGKHSYFQNLEVIKASFAKVIMFEEIEIKQLREMIIRYQPKAIFVDTLCNVGSLTVPKVMEMAEVLKKYTAQKAYLVVDNSMLASGFPYQKLLNKSGRKLGIIMWESLNKFHQFGLDRVTGGVVWGSGNLGIELFNARMHGGTILSDMSTAMMATPNRAVMQKYLARIERNRVIMQAILGERGLSAHTDYGFSGAQVVVKFPKKKSYLAYKMIIAAIVKKARKSGVQIAAGTSFGMPNTRIYLTARNTRHTEMFLRISVGIEEQEEMEKIGKVIASCI